MHDKLFEGHTTWAEKPDIAKETFLGYAKELSLDITKFNTDIASSTLLQKVKDSYQSGIKYGVDRTPSIFVNNNRVVKFDLLKSTIDAELAKTK